MEVADNTIIAHNSKNCHISFARFVDYHVGERVTIAVESTLEGIVLGAHHVIVIIIIIVNGNVFFKRKVIEKYITIIHMLGKLVPGHLCAGVSHRIDDLVGGNRDNFFDDDVVNIDVSAHVT